MQNNLAMEDLVVSLLKNNLPIFYFYHNERHTLYVQQKAMKLGETEKCTPREMELLSAAALWHDTGLIKKYEGHEEESCLLAEQYLPGYGFSTYDIQMICGMIMATKIPQSPHNKLEEIIADADLEYLGTERATEISMLLFRELQYLNPSLTKTEWIQKQIPFLRDHHYFTHFCKEHREWPKKKYLHFLLAQI